MNSGLTLLPPFPARYRPVSVAWRTQVGRRQSGHGSPQANAAIAIGWSEEN